LVDSSDISATAFIPTKEWITKLGNGDLAPDCFGGWSRVVEIIYGGVDVNGSVYIGVWLELGPASKISNSYKEGRPVITIRGGTERRPIRV